jgi:hypothetical protein
MSSQRTKHRDRSAILADISAIENIVEGTLAEMRREQQGGGVAVYYNLQRWKGGRNTTVYVPQERVEAVKAGIKGRERLGELVAELAAVDTAAALSGGGHDAVKKKRKRPSGASRAG